MIEMRVCKKCEQEKTIEEFPLRGGWSCRHCINQRHRGWAEANRDRLKGNAKARRQAKPEKNRQRAKLWYYANKERARENEKRWRLSNNCKYREYHKRYKSEYSLPYVNALLGGTSSNRYPVSLLMLKQMQMKIRLLLKERQL